MGVENKAGRSSLQDFVLPALMQTSAHTWIIDDDGAAVVSALCAKTIHLG